MPPHDARAAAPRGKHLPLCGNRVGILSRFPVVTTSASLGARIAWRCGEPAFKVYCFGAGMVGDSWWNTAIHLPFFLVHTVDIQTGLGIGSPL